ncbi:unnamed protein product, partial [Allacma fusca]
VIVKFHKNIRIQICIYKFTGSFLKCTMEIQENNILKGQSTPNEERKAEPVIIVWKNILRYGYIHVAAGYGLYLLLIGQVQWRTVLWAQMFFTLGTLGITAGAHRYWCHKAFKARTPLRIILALMQTIAFQNSIYDWVRDHRVHHKFSETNADPHNAKRGFFFAHIGWLMCRKHPDVKRDGKTLDMSDLAQDSIVTFQMRHYSLLVLFLSFVIPCAVPSICWGESLASSWFFGVMFRYCASLNAVFCINSFAHLWGNRPYDASINSAEDVILRRVERTGDGSYKGWGIQEGKSFGVHG